ncbi:MAG TPA: LysE family translocator [Crenalkalicoccus sp.]|nr:LysE family translocator [Crenalkalicoccus sp.]
MAEAIPPGLPRPHQPRRLADMPDGLAWFGSVLAFALSMAATPGPNNAMVAASGATWGFRRTLPHLLGVAVGFPLMILAVALGAGEVLRGAPGVQGALRWVGAAYLLWLAWKIATARPAAERDRASGARPGARPLGFLQAAAFQWVNPKGWVAALGAIVTYTTAGEAMHGQSALLAAIFAAVTLPVLVCWTLVGVGAARLLRSPASLRRFNLAMAGLLVASLVPLFLEA